MELAYWEVAAAAWPCDEVAASCFVVEASCFAAGASLEACIEAAVASEVVLVAYSVEDQARQAVHASAWEGIDQQVAAAVSHVASVLGHSHWQKAVAQVHQHHRFEALGLAEQLQTLCVAYASEILGCLLQATSLLVCHGALLSCLSCKHMRQ